MALILCLETSSKNCSVAIANNGVNFLLKEKFDDNYCHGEQLHVLIQNMLKEANIQLSDFDAFAFSAGPGSYTGLRIGASAIKGFAFALDKPVISISTLESMTSGLLIGNLIKNQQYNLFCPTLDSRKGEVYLGFYDNNMTEILAPTACEIHKFNFDKYLQENCVCFFGTGSEKLKSVLTHQNAIFLNEDYPSSKNLCALAQKKFQKGTFEDIAYFEPMYLKKFIPTKSKKSIIHK